MQIICNYVHSNTVLKLLHYFNENAVTYKYGSSFIIKKRNSILYAMKSK